MLYMQSGIQSSESDPRGRWERERGSWRQTPSMNLRVSQTLLESICPNLCVMLVGVNYIRGHVKKAKSGNFLTLIPPLTMQPPHSTMLESSQCNATRGRGESRSRKTPPPAWSSPATWDNSMQLFLKMVHKSELKGPVVSLKKVHYLLQELPDFPGKL